LALRGEYSKDPEKIRLLLAPLLCRTPHEQAEFARHFEPLAEYLAAVQPPIPPSEKDPPGKPKKSFFAGALLHNIGVGSVFLAIMGLIVWLGWQQFAAIVLPIMLLAAGLSVVWFRRDRLDVFLSRRSSRKKQQRQQFSVAGVDEKTIFHSIGLARDAQRLRRHVECPSGKLDIRATLEKTIRTNDWFTPIYRQRKWMPEYLALIDRATFSDHQSQFAEALLAQLETEGVVLNRYYFDCDPRYCYPEAHQLKGYTLPELLERHPEQRL
ncbi:MAG: hypothetical protein GY862_37425, partial [Gammaproteobacteria bacterium]|nr:hypothetical protein [Gammaproteobacteria bacterium]